MAKENPRDLSTDELKAKLEDVREELMNLRFQQSTGELTDFTRIKFTRRQIARYLTIIHQRESAVELEGEG